MYEWNGLRNLSSILHFELECYVQEILWEQVKRQFGFSPAELL